ncbi:MAG: hypothetical protein RI885_561 [Actinomycetota bacterium]|jgi:hypothetical protein
MRKFYKSTLGIAAAGLLVAGLAACSTPAETPAASESSTESADPEPIASIATLSGDMTEVTADQGFVDAITGLGLTPGVLGTATFTDGVFSFPITGGNVDVYDKSTGYRPYVQGSVEHDGSGITLAAGDKTVGLSDFRIDPGTDAALYGTVTLNGELVAEDVNIFRLDGTTLMDIEQDADGNYVLEGTTVYVSEDAAALLNETFGTDAVTGDLVVGIAKITAN